ncbi:MAG: DsbA family protein [Candidatus Azotimanducaceae bacterium WSBS_2022_MAG_OTU7]
MKPAILIKKLVMGFIASDTRRRIGHLKGRLSRKEQPTIHYFHQVSDPYSHLAVQKIDALAARYKVKFEFHLAGSPTDQEQGDATRFPGWALRDARSVAADYSTELPQTVDQIDSHQVDPAESYLSQYLTNPGFTREAIAIGHRLWSGDPIDELPASSAAVEGSALRRKLGHWLGATFYFEGEWYWGVDRLVHLENRLCDMNLSNNPSGICVPRPTPEPLDGKDASAVTLEFFPSLRSPYTAISFDRTIALAQRTGVKLKLRPVMPMMMRGVPAPRVKQFYIMTDAKREADYYGQKFGPVVDPFGEPVKRAFALLPFMMEKELGIDYCANYLRAAWCEGVDITTDQGLQQVVEKTGANWEEAKSQFANNVWEPLLEDNVSDMLSAGLWGVPSFRVTGGTIKEPFCCWGQDRLWRVESEIARRSI